MASEQLKQLNALYQQYIDLPEDSPERKYLAGEMHELCNDATKAMRMKFERNTPNTLRGDPDAYYNAVWDKLNGLLQRDNVNPETFGELYAKSLHNKFRDIARHINIKKNARTTATDNLEGIYYHTTSSCREPQHDPADDAAFSELLECSAKILYAALSALNRKVLLSFIIRNDNTILIDGTSEIIPDLESDGREVNPNTIRYRDFRVKEAIANIHNPIWNETLESANTPERAKQVADLILATGREVLADNTSKNFHASYVRSTQHALSNLR